MATQAFACGAVNPFLPTSRSPAGYIYIVGVSTMSIKKDDGPKILSHSRVSANPPPFTSTLIGFCMVAALAWVAWLGYQMFYLAHTVQREITAPVTTPLAEAVPRANAKPVTAIKPPDP